MPDISNSGKNYRLEGTVVRISFTLNITGSQFSQKT